MRYKLEYFTIFQQFWVVNPSAAGATPTRPKAGGPAQGPSQFKITKEEMMTATVPSMLSQMTAESEAI